MRCVDGQRANCYPLTRTYRVQAYVIATSCLASLNAFYTSASRSMCRPSAVRPPHSRRTVWTYLPQNIGSYFGYRHISRDVAITEGAPREDGKSTDLRRCRRWPDAGDSRLWRQRCIGGAASAPPRPGTSRPRRASGTRHTWTRCSRPGRTRTWRSGPGRTRTRRALLPLEALARWLGGAVAVWQHRPSQIDPPGYRPHHQYCRIL